MLVYVQFSKTVGNVYATDSVLATLMCCTRSYYSWDIVIEKVDGKLFFDKRDNTEFGKPSCLNSFLSIRFFPSY